MDFLRVTQRRNGNLRRIVSLGANDEADWQLTPVDTRAQRIAQLGKLIDDADIEGVEINWESQPTDATNKDRANLLLFVKVIIIDNVMQCNIKLFFFNL